MGVASRIESEPSKCGTRPLAAAPASKPMRSVSYRNPTEHWFYFSQVPRWVAKREPFLQGIEKEDDFLFDNHRKDRLIVGSPQDCIDEIAKFRDGVGTEYMILSFRVAAGPSFEEELECIRRFGADFIPAFKGD